MAAKSLTYARAGVSIDRGNELVGRISRLARATRRPESLGGIGGFGALFRAPKGMRDPVFVAATDGVGTKLRIAFELGRHDTVGVDLVAMNVNDVVTLGAQPLVFLDYFATGGLDVDRAAAVIGGIARGCRAAGCTLAGGETAEMPSFYPAGEYDLAGFVVAAVAAKKIVDGSRIRPGDVVIGLPSSGPHSNGYSLVREIVRKKRLRWDAVVADLGRPLGEALLEPTTIYVKAILGLLDEVPVRGLAHVTGGGIPENLPRILPAGCRARIERGAWEVPPIFRWLAAAGPVERDEMDRTFNQGIGMAVIVSRRSADRALRTLRRRRIAAVPIGEIEKGSGGVRYVG